ncbi:MAG: 30S ribosomal protein S13 [Candidatus Levybacteria bacterium RIFCSPHIGHO2_01_FULL_40_10]|nr:MAG: 30S ribosomal protein S13 [Candidatus Levybacteria bacterium RIFCSPHIGHO2_01_FULL_40_10]
MMRVVGVNIPDGKRVDIALTYIYGIGRSNVYDVLEKAKIEPEKRLNTLSEEELGRIQKALEPYKIEGDLRANIANNIKRLREVASYRGNRHAKNLPVRGQRTRSNARTKRGKRVTIGAIKKEVAVKMGLVAEEKRVQK